MTRTVGLGRAVALLLTLGIAGCVSAEQQANVAAARAESGVRERGLGGMSLSQARTFFAGTTRVVTANNLGSQVSYMAPDGSIYLWFPGNREVLRGRWSLEAAGRYVPVLGRPVEDTRICFEYGANTVNAWSRERGGKQCIPATMGMRMTQDQAAGDVFKLAQRTAVPFILPPSRTTIAAMQAQLR